MVPRKPDKKAQASGSRSFEADDFARRMGTGLTQSLLSFMKRILAALGALSVLLLALSKIGETPIAPGYPTGFHLAENCSSPNALCFETDAEDVRVLVNLSLRQSGTPAGPWTAELSDGTRLAASARRVSGNLWEVRIASDTTGGWRKFLWQNGAVLTVRNRSASPLLLRDWTIYPEKASRDSKARARWRTAWFFICLAFFIVGAIAAVADQLTRQPERTELSQQILVLIRYVVAEIEGTSTMETQQIRQLLELVLTRGVPVTEALERVAPGQSTVARSALFFRARAKFRNHWTTLLAMLDDYLDPLDT
jgi:hypothetical protein